MGEKVLELEPEDWQEMEARVSKLVEAIESLSRRVDYERHRINNLEANRIPKLESAVHENSGKLGVVNDETFGIWAERLNYLSDLQESLDRKTLPKMGRDLVELDTRLNRVEKMTGPHLLVERQDKEKRVTELEKRIIELEDEVRGYHDV